jgi:hypothetical protein
MQKSTTLKKGLIIAAVVLTAIPFVSILSLSSASAADNDCFKAYGNTADEAFHAAVTLLNSKDKEMGEGWIKDNMQINLLPEKINGQFVALIYSTVHHAAACGLDKVQRIADEPRPNCDKTRCTI